MSYEDQLLNNDRKIKLHFRSLKELIIAIENEKKELEKIREIKHQEERFVEKIKRDFKNIQITIKDMEDKSKKEIKETEEKISFLKSEIEPLEKEKINLQKQIENCNHQLFEIKVKIDSLESKIPQLEATKKQIDGLNIQKENLIKEIVGIKTEKDSIQKELEPFENELRNKKGEMSSLISRISVLDSVLQEKNEALEMINAMISVRLKRDKVKQMKDIIDENYGKI